MRVAFYARVSTERQQQAQTIEQQVAQLRSHVAARDGWEVDEAHIFRDDGFSGGKLVRPGLDALRDQAARAAFDLILITAPDRLARNYVHQMVVLEELERRGVRVVFIDRPPSDDPHDQLVLQIRGAVAEYERTLIADRMRRGRLAKLRAGQLLPWTRAPYGYRLHPERPRDPAAVQVDPAAAAIVQELFAAYAAGGIALHALAVRLTGRGVPTPTGQAIWKPSTIRGLLTNPAYRGEAISGRLRTTPARRRRSPLVPVGPGVSMHAQPSEHWITVPVPALVSAEQFELVRRRLAANQQGARRSTTHPYLLRGLVSCGVCHLACVGCTRSSTETRYRYYRCRGKLPAVSSGLAERCPARFTPAAQLDDLVWTDLCAVLRHPEAVAGALERAQNGAWVPDELRRRLTTLRGIRASADRQRARLLDAYLAEIIDLQTFERRDRALREREEELEARERELVAQGRRLVEVGAVARTMSTLCQRLSVGLEQASFAQRRHLVDLLIDRVVVTDGDVEIRYVIPTTEPSLHTRFCHLRTDYFQVEPVDVRPPEDGEVGRAGAAPPQPEQRGDAGLTRQPLHLDQDECPADHRFGASAPAVGMVLGLGVHVGPGPNPDPPILRLLLAVLRRRRPPGGRVVPGQLPPVASGAAGAWLPVGIGGAAPPAPQPDQHRDPLAIEIAQLPGQLLRGVTGVEHAQRDRAVGRPVPEQVTDLLAGDGVRVVRGRHPAHVQRRRPASVREAELREPAVRPAGHDRLAGRLPRRRIVVAPPRAGLGVVARPDAGVERIDRRPVVQGPPPDPLPQRRRVQRPDRQRVVQAAPPPALDRREAQVRQRRDQPGHRGRIQQVEERVAPGPEGAIRAGPEATQAVEHHGIDHAQYYDPDQVTPEKPAPSTPRG